MSATSSPRKIFAFRDNLSPLPEEDGQPKPPRSAFMCFTDAKKKELLESNGLPQKKKDILSLVATEWKKLSDKERAFWDEEARNDKVRYVREKHQYKGEWVVPKRRAKKHPMAPKRPMSAFLMYSQSKRAKVKDENPDMKNTDISRLLGEMWRNASKAERAPFIEQELQQRAAYKDLAKEWRDNQAKADAASRTTHDMIQQTQRPTFHEGSSFDPFVRVHSVEEAVQKVDHDFGSSYSEDCSSTVLPRRKSGVTHRSTGHRYPFQENDMHYRPRYSYAYPFRPYANSGRATHVPNFDQNSSQERGRRGDDGEPVPSTSRYFDRARHSPYGFYQYP